MSCFDLRKISLRQAVADDAVCILCEKAEIGESIDLRSTVLLRALVKLCFRKDVMYFQPTHFTEHVGPKRKAGAPISCLSHPRQQIEHWIKATAERSTSPVTGLRRNECC